MPTRQLNLKTIERDDARVDAFVAALEDGRTPSTSDADTTSEAPAWTTDGFTASGKATGKNVAVPSGWAPQFTASGKMQGKQTD